jgi:hypothetical protein
METGQSQRTEKSVAFDKNIHRTNVETYVEGALCLVELTHICDLLKRLF